MQSVPKARRIWRQLLIVCALCACCACSVIGTPAQEPEEKEDTAQTALPQAAEGNPQLRALLVGCTKYPKLKMRHQLEGPRNDVLLMRDVLKSQYGCPEDQITLLAEDIADGPRPTRDNIVDAFEEFIAAVASGDQVVLYLAGHGSWQPDDDPANDEDLEPDGRDEVFCPADVEGIRPENGQVINAISDDEIRSWLDQLLTKGAAVWFVADSCHSGSVARGDDDRVYRTLRPEDLPVKDAQGETDQDALVVDLGRSLRGTASERVAMEVSRGESRTGELVALYAAQPYELTFEQRLPEGSKRARRYGMLSYTLCQTLLKSGGELTYEDLIDQLHRRYRNSGVYDPTPLLEGNRLDRVVLGTDTKRHQGQYQVEREGDEYRLNAGGLHEVTEGSVLAVYNANEPQEKGKPVGHVKVIDVGPFDATVIPQAFDDQPAPDRLPDQNVCRFVFIDSGQKPLKVAVDPLADDGTRLTDQRQTELREKLKPLAEAPEEGNDRRQRLVEVVRDPGTADWLVRVRGDELVLVPGSDTPGVPAERDPQRAAKIFGPIPENAINDWLAARLELIAAAENVVRLSATSQEEAFRGESPVDVRVKLVKYPTKAAAKQRAGGQEIDLSKVPTLRAGEIVGFKVTNKSRVPVDVCLLFIDSAYGIQQFFPQRGSSDNRLAAWTGEDRPFFTPPGQVIANTLGLEQVAVIAMAADPQTRTANFDFLNQPPVDQLKRGAKRGTRTVRGPNTPLTELMLHAVDSERGTRGYLVSGAEEQKFQLDLMEWQTAPWRILGAEAQPGATSSQLSRALLVPAKQQDQQRRSSGRVFRGPAADVFAEVAPSVVMVHVGEGHGTGFFVDPAGWLVTNHHVIADAKIDPQTGARAATVYAGSLVQGAMELIDEGIPALVYAADEEKDLALLKLMQLPGEKPLPALQVTEKLPRTGTECFAIGHPARGLMWTLREGIVQGLGRWPEDEVELVAQRLAGSRAERDQVAELLNNLSHREVLISSCGINPGDSGGPLVNKKGKVIAVTYAVPTVDVATGVNYDKFTYHVHGDELREFLKSTKDHRDDPSADAPPYVPDVWPPATRHELLDVDKDGDFDVLLFGISPEGPASGALLDLDQDSPSEELYAALQRGEQPAWDFEFAVHFGQYQWHAFYDTDNNGQMDLLLVSLSGSPAADLILERVDDSWVVGRRQSQPLFDSSLFPSQLMRTRFDALISLLQ